MKKNISFALVILFGCLPLLTMAITPGTIPGANELGIQESPVKTPQGLLDIIASIIRWVYTIFFVVAVLFILFAAFNFLTGAGNPEKIKGARNQIMWAVVSIVIALMAVGIRVIIENFLKQG